MKNETIECPKCGSKNLMSTTKGIMCKECKTIISPFSPTEENK